MTLHLLRLMWNRKGRNALLAAEIFFSFAVLCAISIVALNYAYRWRQPLGYRIGDVWNLQFTVPQRFDAGSIDDTYATVQRMMAAVRALPQVRSVGAIAVVPYSNSLNWGNRYLPDGREVDVYVNGASDDLARVLELRMVAGRWFSREDEGDQATIPVVINQQLARAAFGDRNPVGAILPLQDRSRTPIRRLPERVVGVIEEFRKDGEFGALHHYEFRRIEVDRPPSASGSAERPPRLTGPGVFPAALLLRMAPDTPAAFEETLLKTAQAIARDWDFSIRPLEQDRQRELHTGFAVLAVPGLIGLFMLLMVALGLSGVLWQNVTERTGEFGLRRAHGASAAAVRAQVVGELFVLASFAVVPGAIMAAQLPPLLMLLRPDAAPPTIMLAGVVLAVVAIYLLIAVCGWYPSRMATRIRPAEALHYE